MKVSFSLQILTGATIKNNDEVFMQWKCKAFLKCKNDKILKEFEWLRYVNLIHDTLKPSHGSFINKLF
jgi:hypothetical protein